MGCGGSKPSDESRQIEDKLKQEKANSKNTVKTLILGTGESGKSTFIKQLKIILDPDYDPNKPNSGFSMDDRYGYVPIIVKNVYQCLSDLADGMSTLKISYGSSTVEHDINALIKDDDQKVTPENAVKIKAIWEDAGIQKAYQKRSEFTLPDCCKFFMESIDRIGSPNYVPTNDDIVNCRMKTTGILEHKFNVKGTEFMFIDVGGQKSERRKWLHSFETVTSVIFLTSLNDYDLKLAESAKAENRMEDSVKLWEYIVNHESFQSALMIVFLNKRDLFEEKFHRVDFGTHITDYNPWLREKGKQKDLNTCLEFIEYMYRSKIKNKDNQEQKLIFHKTIATNTRAISDVFNSIKQELIISALRKAGML